MLILGIDPGPTTSGVVLYDVPHMHSTGRVTMAHAAMPSKDVLTHLRYGLWQPFVTVIEAMSPRGAPLGRKSFETIEWCGRLREASENADDPPSTYRIHRDEVKLELLGRTNIKGADAHIRQLMADEVGPKGTKADPGPTYGVSAHAWQALGAVEAWRRIRSREIAQAAAPQSQEAI